MCAVLPSATCPFIVYIRISITSIRQCFDSLCTPQYLISWFLIELPLLLLFSIDWFIHSFSYRYLPFLYGNDSIYRYVCIILTFACERPSFLYSSLKVFGFDFCCIICKIVIKKRHSFCFQTTIIRSTMWSLWIDSEHKECL